MKAAATLEGEIPRASWGEGRPARGLLITEERLSLYFANISGISVYLLNFCAAPS